MTNRTDSPDDATPKVFGELDSPTAKLARQLAESPTLKMARELADSPTAKLARQLAESPTLKMASELADSPTAKLARELAESPTLKLARELADSPTAKLAREFAESTTAKLAREMAFAQLDLAEMKLGSTRGISEAYEALAGFGKPYGGLGNAITTFEEQNRKFQKSLLASLGGPIGEISRVSQWASTLGKVDLPEIVKFYPNLPNIAAEVARLHQSVLPSLNGPTGIDQTRISAMLGLNHKLSASLEATRFKMSAFAGITDRLGTQTRAWDEAYRSLFGEWRTRPDLPEGYWRDAKVRRRMYDAAEVDPGLAGVGLKVAVEVVVESGLASGVRSEANAVAVITLGDVSMTIRSTGTRGDAYKVLERFEEELRTFITRKLSAKFGPDWFKQRVDGNVAGEAKRIRKQALERGEGALPLINYTELGHLVSIISGRKNWDEVFGDFFINVAEFDLDMQKLIAARRPTMHIRPIDGVRLVELICVVQRLSRQMENDGAWKLAAESEH